MVPGRPDPVDSSAAGRVSKVPSTTRSNPGPEDALPSTQRSERADAAGAIAGGSHARWWFAVAVGLVVSLPLIWLLSYAATLPFLLGLFFFMLFGLLLGAVTHRVAAPARPYNWRALLAGTAVLVVFVWWMSLIKESHDFPHDMAKDALRMTRDLGTRTSGEFKDEVADQVRTFLVRRYPPGGTLGYTQWMATSGRINRGELPAVSRTLRRGQARVWYAIRVVLSLALLGFGIGSQTLPLRLATEPVVRAIDEPSSRGHR